MFSAIRRCPQASVIAATGTDQQQQQAASIRHLLDQRGAFLAGHADSGGLLAVEQPYQDGLLTSLLLRQYNEAVAVR